MDRQCFFDQHAKDWDSSRHAKEDFRLARVVALAQVQSGHAVLDVGTGTGVLVPHLLRTLGPAGRIAAIDLSAAMLETARHKGFPPNVTFSEADVHQIPFPNADFDRVICNAAFPHFADRARSLGEMIRVLRPGGILVISHPIGREAVNALHREAGGPVEEDRVPTANVMVTLLQGAALTDIGVIDEPEFYLVRGTKP